ncbi:Metallo-hydrolase/oxidoreductase [Trametes coccinea BRFM310]|uniref:Metallo-hydrolase/oxidoreductase n=1 Tax=Trametes coccinea (strain BRFM310) TaxID=1353009 RepID=A0A1Y2IAR7_TRAC3|nr:Metallo-hydrolase/oxidoreductase [Trametes coccinea BRFM310]
MAGNTAPSAQTGAAHARNVVVEEARSLREVSKERPAHHLDDTQTRFANPWPSFRFQERWQWVTGFFTHAFNAPKVPNDLSARIPSRTPDWGAGAAPDKIKATWLGHACYMIELPAPEGASRGARILFDPVLSHRCSPFQSVGPARLLPTPCPAEDIPAVDAICISHNHYDHMDLPTLRTVFNLHQPHIFVPLGNRNLLRSISVPDSHIHVLDWWDARTVSLSLPRAAASSPQSTQDAGVDATFVVTCTPAQHTANRTPFDRWRTLWSSWAIEHVAAAAAGNRKVYFAGDTGYRTVRGNEDEDKVPRCPAFAEIGEKLGPFDLALLPIGAYAPRAMWSNLHASPSDAVQIFKDVRAKNALAMHWGTWTLTVEPLLEPPELLKKECAKEGLQDGAFDVSGLGETRFF